MSGITVERRQQEAGFIYAISWDIPDCPIKIGSSIWPEGRICALGTSSPFPVIVHCIWELPEGDMRHHEAVIHAHLATHRVRNEWFERDAALRFLEDYASKHSSLIVQKATHRREAIARIDNLRGAVSYPPPTTRRPPKQPTADHQAKLEARRQAQLNRLAHFQAKLETWRQAQLAVVARRQAKLDRMKKYYVSDWILTQQAKLDSFQDAQLAELARRQAKLDTFRDNIDATFLNENQQ